MTFAATLTFEFARPALLLLLPLALAWIVGCWLRSLIDLPMAQRIASLLIRLTVVLLLVCALAGLTLMSPTKRKFIVVALDLSQSVGADARAYMADWLSKVGDASGHELAILPFAASPGRIRDGLTDGLIRQLNGKEEGLLNDDERRATDLEAVVEVATASIPPFYVPEVVVITDGNQTHGDLMRAASISDVPISTVPLPSRSEVEVQIAEIVVPALVRQGEPFTLELIVDSSRSQTAQLQVYRDGIRVDLGESSHVSLTSGENRFYFRQRAGNQRRILYTARIEAEHDTLLDNNHASGWVTATGKPRVLLADSDLSSTDSFRWALEEQSITVDPRPVQGVPAELSEIQNYDAVILSNVAATDLSLSQLQTLRSYVQKLGGGLVVIGGDQAFGLGGYYKTTLEEILPVRSDFKQEREKPSLAMVLIIDRSGSMGGAKLELAKDAARGAVELLGPRDQIGVLAFDIETHWVSELHSAADKEFVTKRISTLAPGGGTNMYPAMVQAHRALQTAVAKLKHVIILTDGISSPGDFTGVTADLVSDRITVSTVAIGDGADLKLLEDIAEQGNGRHYVCADPQSVPQVFAKETVTAGRSAIRELPLLPQQLRGAEFLGGIELDQVPPLFGYVATRPKLTGEVVWATEEGEPLLAWWRYGLGKTLVFTSDAKSRWAAEWLAWSDFPRFWAQLVRHVMRHRDQLPGELRVRRSDGEAHVTLDVVDEDGQFRNRLPTNLTVVRPDGDSRLSQIPMLQTAPGYYEAQFDASLEGSYFLDVIQTDRKETTFQQSRGMFVGYPSELRLRPTDEPLLRQVCEASGGRFDVAPDQLFANDRTAQSARPVWPHLLITALVLFVVDVALRRIPISRPA